MKKLGYVIIFGLMASLGYAQEQPPLIKPEVEGSQVMFKRMVWRRMDMTEKQNRPFFSLNGELSRLLIQAVNEGLITPYKSDSCVNFMSDDEFVSHISVERNNSFFGGDGFNSGFSNDFDDGFNNDFSDTNTTEDTETEEDPTASDDVRQELIPEELFSVAYIREELIFDRNRSRMYHFIRSISLALPTDAGSDWNPGGFEKYVAHFKYEEVVDLFRGPYADRAKYYNNQNFGAHLNMSDAFELRLFSAPIIKVSNAQDLDIRQIYADELARDPMSVILIQQKYEYDLMEYESELWEY